jgi:predicted RNA-binding protein YlxR (DUF448 family)
MTTAGLVRVVRLVDGTLGVGRTLSGRGAWLCAGSAACLQQARDRNAFGRALRGPVSETALDALTAELLPVPATNSFRGAGNGRARIDLNQSKG